MYQAVSRGLDRRLEQLGASRVCERGEGDDKETMESDWDSWTKEKFVPLLMDPFKDAKEPAQPAPTALKTFTYLPYLLTYASSSSVCARLVRSPLESCSICSMSLRCP